MDLTAFIELSILSGHKDRVTVNHLRNVRRHRQSLLSGNEAFMVHSVASALSALPGDMAEVGVYEGCSARLISEASGGIPLHLFDTFGGLPPPEEAERGHLREHQYIARLDRTRSFLADRPNVRFYPGLFPETAIPLREARFSFVHIDVDLKASTRACLEFFYPRLVQGGAIMTHDYSYLDGVREAFAEFMASKPSQLIELPTSQAILFRAA